MFECVCVCACDCFSVVLIKKCMKKIYIIYLYLAFEPPAPTGFQSINQSFPKNSNLWNFKIYLLLYFFSNNSET